MSRPHVLVVGGGPAGVAAAIDLAAAGLAVTLMEQATKLGGAIHHQPNDPARKVGVPMAQRRRWATLTAALSASDVEVRFRHLFAGVDGTGLILSEDRAAGTVCAERFEAVIIAIGGLERVLPRPGAHLPGVVTAGGLQIMMKATGCAPVGDVLLAGSGPLLIALGAQMAAAGNSPIAILERSKGAASPWLAVRLLRSPAYLIEAAAHLFRLWRAGVPWRRGVSLSSIRQTPAGRLEATFTQANGRRTHVLADRIALHDGLRANSPAHAQLASGSTAPHVIFAGDCREALGGVAAIADGRRAAGAILAQLRGDEVSNEAAEATLERERRAQGALARHFDFTGPDLSDLPDDTILCRCEGRTVGELRALLEADDLPSPREIKLNGRFAMGACQGRFCAEWTAAFLAAHTGGPPQPVTAFTGNRWPLKPISISSFLQTKAPDAAPPQTKNESD